MNPVRIKLINEEGFDLQKTSRDMNGLEAVDCSKGGTWGNPFREWPGFSAGDAGDAFRAHLENDAFMLDKVKRELRRKNLACSCELKDPCHVDVLIKVANNML